MATTTATQTCDVCGRTPKSEDAHSLSDAYLCGRCMERAWHTLCLVAKWWADGGASICPEALLGDKPIREQVEKATGIRRE